MENSWSVISRWLPARSNRHTGHFKISSVPTKLTFSILTTDCNVSSMGLLWIKEKQRDGSKALGSKSGLFHFCSSMDFGDFGNGCADE